ncbi:MAG TPA: DinB family protein [candidate division Zixibacteria bacterium]|nr:DinB family protein [candidate division Zixibacteria bacterium]
MNQVSAIDPVGPILTAYAFNLKYAGQLVTDVPPDLLYRSYGPGTENHPAFTLGHLVIASALMAEYLGDAYDVPEGWDALFRRKGPGDPRRPDTGPAGAPSKQDLLSALTVRHQRVAEIVTGLSAEDLTRRSSWRFSDHFPRMIDLIQFMCVTHEAMHLAQAGAWRRVAGLDSALARL